ncbi:MAG: septal ring lytic transglycosylase RlpA family protein [Azonexus sp.]|nr:septal ring lytic transglycosylase RlpA family protein [Azonexus sp.]
MKFPLAIPLTVISLWLAGCGSAPERPQVGETSPETRPTQPGTPAKPQAPRKGGGYYKDDGPADDIPANLDSIPDAVPRNEPLHKPALKPYEVFGRQYVPNTRVRPYRASGIASWYGRKFHGQKTSIGEPYDMFAMTAAHPTLALPSYVRVSNPANGKSVIVRVIDRGPFHADRVIDLSYTAAYKLGIVQHGSARVDVEAILPDSTDAIPIQASSRPIPVVPETVTTTLPAGVYLQLGAFSNTDNAGNLKRHLMAELDWLDRPIHLVKADALHRVQLGPFASRSAAEPVAEKIRNALGFKPGLVTR